MGDPWGRAAYLRAVQAAYIRRLMISCLALLIADERRPAEQRVAAVRVMMAVR